MKNAYRTTEWREKVDDGAELFEGHRQSNNFHYCMFNTIVDSDCQLGDFSSSESLGEIRMAWYH